MWCSLWQWPQRFHCSYCQIINNDVMCMCGCSLVFIRCGHCHCRILLRLLLCHIIWYLNYVMWCVWVCHCHGSLDIVFISLLLQLLPLQQDFVAAIAGTEFCAAVAVPDHMTYELCHELGSCHAWIVWLFDIGRRVLLQLLLWQISLQSLLWQDFVVAIARFSWFIYVW